MKDKLRCKVLNLIKRKLKLNCLRKRIKIFLFQLFGNMLFQQSVIIGLSFILCKFRIKRNLLFGNYQNQKLNINFAFGIFILNNLLDIHCDWS